MLVLASSSSGSRKSVRMHTLLLRARPFAATAGADEAIECTARRVVWEEIRLNKHVA